MVIVTGMARSLATGVWRKFGVVLRIYLTGEICLLGAGGPIRAADFPRRQGRLAFAYLISERARPVPREDLAEAVWPERLPRASEIALSALVSKLRSLLAGAGVAASSLSAVGGCYLLELPGNSWVDVEAALESIHLAEGALRAGAYAAGYGPAVVAAVILRRPFLPGLEGGWVDERREVLRRARVRALEALAEIHEWNRELPLALNAAQEAIALEPLRESGYRRLMGIHQRAGNRAEALRAYERCRGLLANELGVAPEPQTQALRDQVLALR
jgi:DNA-binding SARP family transcriptional activator